MAVETRTIIAGGGGDYTTLAGWESAAEHATTIDAGDIYKGVISDNSEYDEAITISAGTPTATAYSWLTVDPANAYAGVYDTGKARLHYTGATTAAIQIENDYTRIDWMQLQRSGASFDSSDEGMRVSNADNCLISYCVIWANPDVVHTDGIYITGTSTPTSIDDCILYGWGRTGIISQLVATRVVNIDQCTVVLCGRNTGSDQYGIVGASNGAITTYNIYNTIICENASGAETIEISALAVTTLNGSHIVVTANNATYISATNLTNNATDFVAAPDQVTDTAPASGGVYVTDDTLGSVNFDATLIDHANNVAIAAGTNRQGSEPDSRQDFAVAVNGTRPTTDVDIGAFQLQSGADTIDISTATETDTAGTLTVAPGAVTINIGTASETDTAGTLTVSTAATVALGTASETDSAGTLTPVAGAVTIDIGTASETDTAGTITPSSGAEIIDIGTATETDTAQTLTVAAGSAQVAIGTAAETDTAGTLTIAAGAASVALATAGETDTAGTITPVVGAQIVNTGTASETDTAGTLVVAPGAATINIGTAAETDTAGTLVPSAGGEILIDPGTENDTAGTITPVAGAVTINIGTASETDSAGTITPVVGAQIVNIGTALEVDTAGVLVVAPGAVTIVIGTAGETDTAGTITPTSGAEIIAIATATETDSAGALTVAAEISIDIGTASEVDTANELAIIGPQFVALVTAAEADTAGAVTLFAAGVVVGSWYQLLAIYQEARRTAEVEAATPPVDCPVCGDQLRTGPQGGLYCPFNMSHPVGYGWGIHQF